MARYRAKVLAVDDDRAALKIFEQRLAAMRLEVITASDGQAALDMIRQEAPAVTLLDLMLPKMDGLEVLRALKREDSEATVIVVTAYGTIERAVEAMRHGAYDFLTKPIDPQHLEVVVNKALEREDLKRSNRFLAGELEAAWQNIVGESPKVRQILDTARRAAAGQSTVLLLGESGTGKEVVARAIHGWSPRKGKPFVVVNCVALSEQLLESELFGHEKGAFTGAVQMKRGKFEIASGGTVFLDEIGDMRPGLQAKLLRVVQEHEFERVGGTRVINVDVRIIAATNRDLEKAVQDGSFREDLYYRLNVVSLTLPPLRDRKEDIPALVDHFVKRYARETKKTIKGVSQDAMRALLAYHWPGNVRELENVVERAVVLSLKEEIVPDDLPAQLVGGDARPKFVGQTFHQGVRDFKRAMIQDALHRAGGSRTKASEMLGLQRTYLVKLIRLLAVEDRA